jgi:hypothetical protein
MNFIADNNSIGFKNSPVDKSSCGDRSSCGSNVDVKRAHASKEKESNSAGATCNS